MAEVNVEEIMREIHKRAEELQIEEPVQFEDIPVLEKEVEDSRHWKSFDAIRYECNLGGLNEKWFIPYYKDMSGNPLVQFIKRIIRKLTRCSVEHVAEDATAFNTYCVRTINEMALFIREQQKTNEENSKRIAALEKQLSSQKN